MKKVKKIKLKSEGKTIWKMGECLYQEVYSGEVDNDIPNGQGVSEEYECYELPQIADPDYLSSQDYNNNWNIYSKDLMHKEKGFYLTERYTGEWKSGKKHGKGKLIRYHSPSTHQDYPEVFKTNENGLPEIYEVEEGIFEEGFFRKKGKSK